MMPMHPPKKYPKPSYPTRDQLLTDNHLRGHALCVIAMATILGCIAGCGETSAPRPPSDHDVPAKVPEADPKPSPKPPEENLPDPTPQPTGGIVAPVVLPEPESHPKSQRTPGVRLK